ncbi:LytR C-terminal domain-containing protein [Actinokineospora diospyrosa]|uniref:LytR cell envelope-related transcriptional attenuator n=1 Tax=Actinokineospora diospyrosa TaxID=103728 RepID=A0ABT1IGW3_9PSEU|nr:LytR C-terminal domain-containing protein [Actinokineospora diospyrosa]MCP2271884.1 LytR cell envelope-related transcriptional attenuator [Actinokineospora diospyrosa]
MSTDSTGQARTARVVGLTLLAVAAAAAVIGVITLFDSAEETPPSAQSALPAITTTQPAPPSGDLTSLPPRPTSPGQTSAQPTTTQPPAVTSAPPASTAPPAATSKPGGTADAPSEPLRIYNNSTITGLAARAAEDIGSAGWNIAQTGNYSGGKIPTTTVYFEPGTGQEEAARQLADQFGFRVEARFDGIKDSSPGLILIVTNDYKVVKEK